MFYPEINKGIEVLRRATIMEALDTFIGKPLTIEHIDPRMNVADEAVMAKVSHGVVDKVGLDKDTGWFYCEGTIASEAARAGAATMNPSCGFRVNETGAGGRWNNLPYERELTNIEFHHLALTNKRPRYEEAEFRLNSVLSDQGKTMKFKLLRTIAAALTGGAPTVQEVDVPEDATVKLANGKEVRLNAVIEAHEKAETAAATAAEEQKKKDAAAADASRTNAVTDDTEVLVAGKKVKVKDLTAAYEARENAAAAETKRLEDEARLNAAKGSADFTKLQNAAETGKVIRTDFPQTAGTLAEGLKRGKY